MSAQWPVVVERLVALLPTLPGWGGVAVFDGPPVTDEQPSDFCTVGFVDDDNAGSYSAEPFDEARTEEIGEVRCQLASVSGDENLAAVRTRCFALANAFEVYLRTNQTLGGTLSADGTTRLTTSVLSVQNPNGAAQSLVLGLQYLTRT